MVIGFFVWYTYKEALSRLVTSLLGHGCVVDQPQRATAVAAASARRE